MDGRNIWANVFAPIKTTPVLSLSTNNWIRCLELLFVLQELGRRVNTIEKQPLPARASPTRPQPFPHPRPRPRPRQRPRLRLTSSATLRGANNVAQCYVDYATATSPRVLRHGNLEHCGPPLYTGCAGVYGWGCLVGSQREQHGVPAAPRL